MTAPSNFAYSFIPVGIQTVGGEPLIGVVVDLPFDGTAVTVADVASAEVADARIEVTGSVQLEETGWGLYALDPTEATLTAPCLGIWLATIGPTDDSDSMLVAYSPLVQTDGVVDPSWDGGVAFLPFEARGVGVESIVAGANVTVDDSDPAHPVVSSSGDGGGGDVTLPIDASDVIIDPEGEAVPVDEAFATAVALITPLQNLPWLRPVNLVATADVDISSAPSTIDGVTVSGYVLLTNQADPAENGIYDTSGGFGAALVVSALHPSASQVAGARVVVTQGTSHAGETWGIETGSRSTGDAAWEDKTGGGAGSGDVSGPGAAVTADRIVLWSGTSGTDIKQASVGISSLVPTTTTVNGHALSSNVTVTASDVGAQPLDSDLTAIAALATDSFGRDLLTKTSSSAVRTYLGLVLGSDVQAYDPDLAALAGVTSAADKVPYFTGSGTASTMTVTSAARSVLDDTTTAAMLTTLGAVPLASAPLTIVKGTDQTYQSDATLNDDSVLQFTFGAGETWTFDCILYAYGPTAADFAVGCGYTGTAVVRGIPIGPASSYSGSAASEQTQGIITAFTTTSNAGTGVWGTGTSAAAGCAILLRGTVITTTSGLFTIQHCQAVSTGTDTTVEKFSQLTLRRTT